VNEKDQALTSADSSDKAHAGRKGSKPRKGNKVGRAGEETAQAKSDRQSKESEDRSKAKSQAALRLHTLISTRPIHPDGRHPNPLIKSTRI
jgi:hypothetical protein